MRTERKDILIKEKQMQEAPVSEVITEQGADPVIRFHVMQSLKHNKWVLAAVRGIFEAYQVTDVMSSNADLMVSYAHYLNDGVVEAGLEQRQREMLDALKERYRILQ